MIFSYRNFFWFQWFSCFLLIYVIHASSKIFGFDAFLAEKILSFVFLFFCAFVFFERLKNDSVSFCKKRIFVFLCFCVMFFYLLFLNKFGYGPILFVFYSAIVSLFLSFSSMKMCRGSGRLEVFALIIMFLHVLAYFSGLNIFFQQGDRFVGLFSSPTTFATWIIMLFVVSSDFNDLRAGLVRRFLVLTSFISLLILVFLTGTRTNLLLVLFVGFYFFIGGVKSSRLRFYFTVSAVFFVFMVYPVYSIVSVYLSGDFVAYRYDGGEDASFELRVSLFNFIFERLVEVDFYNLLFGHGLEASRYLVLSKWGVDLLPHNDVLRLFYDFGIVFCLMFFGLLALLSSRGHLSFLATIIYIFSFVHNMVYSHYLISAILLLSVVDDKSAGRVLFNFQRPHLVDFSGNRIDY